MQSLQAVVSGQGLRLCMVRLQSLDQRSGIVVAASHQWFASYVVGHGHLGRSEFVVIRSTASLVDGATGDAAHQQTVVDAELDDCVQFLVALGK